MIIAEDLLLLLYADATGKAVVDRTKVDHALAGAVLIELAMAGRVDIAGENDVERKGRLVVRDRSPLGDDVLDDALRTIDDKEGRKPQDVLGKLAKRLRDRLLDRLADRGVLERREEKVLGLFPTTRWPAADAQREAEVRSQLDAALLLGKEPDPRTGALVAMLSAIDVLPKVVDAPDRKAVRQRAKQIAESAWAADAVRKAVESVQAATTAVIVSAAVAGSAGSS
jgi:Golgi phosphoprotein 3 (GPP34)